MRAWMLPVPHNTAILEGEEMNVFQFSYYFCFDSDVSWPTLDTDLSRHFCFVPLPLFQFLNLYFALHAAAACPETTIVWKSNRPHTTHMLIFLWNQVSHFQSLLPAEEDDVLCCDNSENPLLLSAWIRRELLLFVGQKQISNVHVLQWDKSGWAISLPTNTEAKNLHLITQAYSYSPVPMRLGTAQGKREQTDGG